MNRFDRQRGISIARYLFSKLRQRYPEGINDSAFSKLLYPEVPLANTRNSRVKSLLSGNSDLTTGKLVDLIKRINQNNSSSGNGSPGNSSQTQTQVSYSPLLTAEETLMLFQRLIQLTPEEKRELGLLTGVEEVLLQQALLNMRLYRNRQNYEAFLDLYCTSISLPAAPESVSENFLEQIYDRIPEILAAIHDLPEAVSQKFVQQVEATVRQEIDKILLKSGMQHKQFWNTRDHVAYVKRYLTAGFVERLVQAVAENELLMQDFPIYIRKITIEDLGTLPLPATPTAETGLFNQDLLDLDRLVVDRRDRGSPTPRERTAQAHRNIADLASQSALRVTIHFAVQPEDGTRINFVLFSSGIGGTLSQIVKVINMALLSDIACLQDQDNGRNFFPIAHDVMVNQTIVQNNTPSPVWAHSLVMLCQSDILAKAMTESSRNREICFYDQVAFGDSVGRGDCCAFDFLQTVAKSALYARLRAIKHAGVDPAQYLQDLRDRIERTRLVQESRHCLTSYPFSSLAQEGWMRQLLVGLGYWNKDEIPASAPQAVFEAYLVITETFLQEGMYRRAYGYLRRLKPALGRLAQQSTTWYESFHNTHASTSQSIQFENFSGALLVRYQLCWATYYYLLDRSHDRAAPQYFDRLPPDADDRSIIHEAWDAVDKAEDLAAVRLEKYLIINEISQGTFHPHYHLLAQIYFLRLRLLLFFPQLAPSAPRYMPVDLRRRTTNSIYGGCLYLLEKSRLYAACDGNKELYACYTAYQSCIYVMASFLDRELTLAHGDRESNLSPQDCMKWAHQMRDHALLSYAETGRHCYYQIKEKSGISQSLNRSVYGKYSIAEIPPIREMLNQDEEKPGQHENGILYIDMELLSIPRECCHSLEDNGDPKERIYLFGSNACYLLFARGLYHLCSNDRKEFETSIASDSPTAAEWDQKFSRAYHLFNYACTMAEDGGNLNSIEGEEGGIRVERNFRTSESTGLETEEQISAYAKSVRDLYPRRVTEIAELAKIFMATSALLRLYVSLEDPNRLRNEFANPLSTLYRESYCETGDLTARVLKNQPRFNGHLEPFLSRCVHILQDEVRRVQPLIDADSLQISEQRNRILRRVFEGFAIGCKNSSRQSLSDRPIRQAYSNFQLLKLQIFCCVPRSARHTTKNLNILKRKAL